MQYRIIFFPGTGGDGFISLLERADNIVTADGLPKTNQDGSVLWRKHKVVGGKQKFHGPRWVTSELTPFRFIKVKEYTLNPVYVDAVKNNKHIVVGAHYNYWDEVIEFRERGIVTKNAVAIHLYSSDLEQVLENCLIKNELDSIDVDLRILTGLVRQQLENEDYRVHIDITKVRKDWSYLKSCLDAVGIRLDKKYYDEWLTIITD